MVGDAFEVNVSYDELQGFNGGRVAELGSVNFYQMLKEMNILLFKGLSGSKLSMCVRLLPVKPNQNNLYQCLNFFAKMMLYAIPTKDNLPTSFYVAKR